MTVRYGQIIAHLKIRLYPTHSDYCSLAIKFNILSLSMFYLFQSVMFEGAKSFANDRFWLNYDAHCVSSALCK